MNNTSNPSIKSKVITLLYRARQQQQEFVDDLSETERNAIGTQENWSAKDVVANLNAWKHMQTGKLATALQGKVPPVWKEGELVNAINAQIYADAQHSSWQEVLDESERAFVALVAQVERMSEEELADPNHYDWQDGEALWGETLGNGAWFPFTQMTDYHYRHGDTERAVRTHETLIEAIRDAGLPSEDLGGALYNMACFYAKMDYPEKALAALTEALQLRPTLAEWAKQDADLASLHNAPDFQILCQQYATKDNEQNMLMSRQAVHEQDGTALLIIDVRGPKEYDAGHVAGAINIPLSQLSRKLSKLSHDRPIVTYCNMHHRGESRGERAANMLREKGYEVRTLDGGYPAWKEAGLPVE